MHDPSRSRRRIVLLWTIAVVTPWLLATMAVQPSDTLEASGQGGNYIYTPACGTPMQVVHGESQLRWTHRSATSPLVTHLDFYGSWSDSESRRSDDDLTETKWMGLLRAQGGIDWSIVGFRLGAAGGYSWTERSGNQNAEPSGTTSNPILLPAGSVRLGPQWLNFRSELNTGDWSLRPMELKFGVAFGTGSDDPSADQPVQFYLGWGGELIDATSDGFAYFGARLQTDQLGFGLQTRFGSDGGAGGIWIGLPI